MNFNFAAVVTCANRVCPDLYDRPRVIESALVYALTETMALPGTRVASVRSYFEQTIVPALLSKLGVFNEEIVINIDRARGLAESLWMIRYYAAFPTALRITPQCGFVDAFVRADVFLTPEQHEFLNKYKVEIAKVYQLLATADMMSDNMIARASVIGL